MQLQFLVLKTCYLVGQKLLRMKIHCTLKGVCFFKVNGDNVLYFVMFWLDFSFKYLVAGL